MNPIAGLFAAPSAVGLVGQTASAATSRFNSLLQTAKESYSQVASPEGEPQEAVGLEENVARRLQELLASLGVGPGEKFRLSSDDDGLHIRVDGHPLAGDVEDAIVNQPSLVADLQELLGSAASTSAGLADAQLQVEAAGDQDVAILEWR